MLAKGSEEICKSLEWHADFCPECGEAIKVVFPSTSNNKAMLKLLCDVEHAIRNGLSYSVTKESNLYKNIVEEISQHQHS